MRKNKTATHTMKTWITNIIHSITWKKLESKTRHTLPNSKKKQEIKFHLVLSSFYLYLSPAKVHTWQTNMWGDNASTCNKSEFFFAQYKAKRGTNSNLRLHHHHIYYECCYMTHTYALWKLYKCLTRRHTEAVISLHFSRRLAVESHICDKQWILGK